MHKMLLDLPAQIETERLILRPYRAGDGPAYHEVCMRNKEHLMPFEEGNPALDVNTVEDAEILMRRFAADWVSRSVFFLGAWEKASGAFAAQMYVGVVSWDLPEFEVGYWADERQEGRGFVTEGAKAALRFCFEALGAHRVRLECNEMNARSWRVAERCGFVREGHIRPNKKKLKRADGTYSGDYHYGMLRAEYEALFPHPSGN
jgi:ribosomal-protein-serine acetyltransferase